MAEGQQTVISVDGGGNRGAISRAAVAAIAGAGRWRPLDLYEALGTLDRLARFCEFSCAPESDFCLREQCEAWQIERAAADWLECRWLDGQD